MVAIKDIRLSNNAFKASKKDVTALFVGGTSGVGKGTLIQLAKHAPAPTVYLVGRSKNSATSLLDELKSLNSEGNFIFTETEVSLIKNVDAVCEQIKVKEKKLDLLFMSAGYLTLNGRNETSEGIDTLASLSYYSRLRFAYNLLPLLSAAPNGRVISILAGGKERGLDINDLELHKNYSIPTLSRTCATQTVLSFELLAKKYPTVTFCHVYPGFVNTGQLDRLMVSLTGVWRYVGEAARWTLIPVLSYFAATTVDVAGERGLFIATSAKFPPTEKVEGMVELPEGVEMAKSSVERDRTRSGVYRLAEDCNSVSNECDQVLEGYRTDGTQEKVWEETLKVWERALQVL